MGEEVTRRLQAILMADVVGYSSQMERDETGTFTRLQHVLKTIVDPQITAHGGEVVKRMGDGLLAVYPSAVAAVESANAIQRAMALCNADTPDDQRMVFRIGLNIGDVMSHEGDVFGDGVNIAARLESLAVPGGIAVSASVVENVSGRVSVGFEDLGERQVKGIQRPVRAYLVRESGRAATPPIRRARWKIPVALLLLLALIVTVGWSQWSGDKTVTADGETVPDAQPAPQEAASAPVPVPEAIGTAIEKVQPGSSGRGSRDRVPPGQAKKLR